MWGFFGLGWVSEVMGLGKECFGVVFWDCFGVVFGQLLEMVFGFVFGYFFEIKNFSVFLLFFLFVLLYVFNSI